MGYELIAAVDLGFNSFHLQVGRVVEPRWPLAATCHGGSCAASASACGASTRGSAGHEYQRCASGEKRLQLLAQAEAVLDLQIEIIAGREEARLIF